MNEVDRADTSPEEREFTQKQLIANGIWDEESDEEDVPVPRIEIGGGRFLREVIGEQFGQPGEDRIHERLMEIRGDIHRLINEGFMGDPLLDFDNPF